MCLLCFFLVRNSNFALWVLVRPGLDTGCRIHKHILVVLQLMCFNMLFDYHGNQRGCVLNEAQQSRVYGEKSDLNYPNK